MHRAVCAFLTLSCSISLLAAQTVQDSELIFRLRMNQAKYSSFDNGVDLRAQADAKNDNISINSNITSSEGIDPDAPRADDFNHWRIRQAAFDSDLVVTGSIKRQISGLTAGHGFVFTDSEFIIDEIWESKAQPRLSAGEEITVTSPGGSVVLDGHRIEATFNAIRLFTTRNHYLLFLKYLPDSHSYELVSPLGFDISGPEVVPLQTNIDPPAKQYLSNVPGFLQAMRSSTLHAVGDAK